jgi:hypothetical protein
MTPANLRIAAASLLLASCAGPSAERAASPRHAGTVAFQQNGVVKVDAAFDAQRLTAARTGRPLDIELDRTPRGTWKGTMGSVPVELEGVGSRLTGPGVDVTMTRVDGGYRLQGMWRGGNADLTVTSEEAVAQGQRWTRTGSGDFVMDGEPTARVKFTGEAARTDDPPWPEVAIATLGIGWGVQSWFAR